MIELIEIKCKKGDYYIGGLNVPDIIESHTFKCKKCGTLIFLKDKDYNNMEFQRLQNRDNRYRMENIYSLTEEEMEKQCKIVSTVTCRGEG